MAPNTTREPFPLTAINFRQRQITRADQARLLGSKTSLVSMYSDLRGVLGGQEVRSTEYGVWTADVYKRQHGTRPTDGR